MRAPPFLRKKGAFYSIVFLIALTAFAADILDLREELHLLSCPGTYQGSNISAGIISHFTFHTVSILFVCSVIDESSVKISLHHLPYCFRAPPSRS